MLIERKQVDKKIKSKIWRKIAFLETYMDWEHKIK